jgi:predicted DNA-binding helix-hairpin-helix protein
MLRVLMTNRCKNSCTYCENAAQRDFQEATLLPEELALHFANLYRKGAARSLFLSSAVRISTEHTMTRMAETLELIRFRHRIPAYIHVKILPDTPDDLIQRVLHLATRVSVNLEVPNRKSMEKIGSPKDFDHGLYGRLRYISTLLRDPALKKKSQTTQFVVGVADETDRELLSMMSHLYKDLELSRIYFSAFQTPGKMEFGVPRAPLAREHRLYQADFLLRKYGFKAEEISLSSKNHLSLQVDPKTGWALRNPGFFPVEINTAAAHDLLRVPGLGPVSVRRILRARKEGRITARAHLEALRIKSLPALRYLLLDGVRIPLDGGMNRQNRFEFV